VEILAANRYTSAFVTAIAAGGLHSLFIESDGSLWGIGYDLRGQLGGFTNINLYVPARILPSGATAIAAGEEHSLWIKSDGSLWAMGDNTYGVLSKYSNLTTHVAFFSGFGNSRWRFEAGIAILWR
jgi:alpha-tubulin suppressor-like RCC1 family protein